MSTTLQVDLDPRVVAFAEAEARRRDTTVTAVISQQLQVMAQNWQDSEAQRTPLTDSLRGVLPMASDREVEQVLSEELIRRHG
ncbi:MAG: hypothetical protein H3C27_14950 [Opitutaceae bacterium]|nr:hypothetical protein [Opitutaceae bacterium]